MAIQTPTIDVQVHAYERNHPVRPWAGFLQGPEEVTGGDMVAAMDAVGVDGALLISPFSLYQPVPIRCQLRARGLRGASGKVRLDPADGPEIGNGRRRFRGVGKDTGCGRSPHHAHGTRIWSG